MSMFCGGTGGEGGEGPAEHANLCRQGMQSGMQSDNGSDQIEGSRIRSLEQSDRMLGSTRASVIDELFEQRGRGGLLRGHDSAFGTCNGRALAKDHGGHMRNHLPLALAPGCTAM